MPPPLAPIFQGIAERAARQIFYDARDDIHVERVQNCEVWSFGEMAQYIINEEVESACKDGGGIQVTDGYWMGRGIVKREVTPLVKDLVFKYEKSFYDSLVERL